MIEIKRSKIEEIYNILSTKLDEKLPATISYFVYRNLKHLEFEAKTLYDVKQKLFVTEKLAKYNERLQMITNSYSDKYDMTNALDKDGKVIPYFANHQDEFLNEVKTLRAEYSTEIKEYETNEKELNTLLEETIEIDAKTVTFTDALADIFSVRELMILDVLIVEPITEYTEV